MEFDKEAFDKAIKEEKIVRYRDHFERVVKAYLKHQSKKP
jgi:hypothetical protein